MRHSNSRLLFVLIVMCVALVTPVTFVILAWQGGPVDSALSLAPTTHNFGLVHETEKRVIAFRLKNYSGTSQRISKVSTSCGCTLVKDIVGQIVRAYDSLEVPVTVDFDGRAGPFNSEVYVFCEGFASPNLFRVSATVFAECPLELSFGEIKEGAIISKTFHFKYYPGDETANPVRAAYDDAVIDVTQHGEYVSRQGLEFRVTPNPRLSEGYWRTVLKLEIGRPVVRTKEIVVDGTVLGPLSLSSQELVLRCQVGDIDAPSSNVSVYSPYGRTVEIESIENPRPDAFSYIQLPQQTDDAIPMEFRYLGCAPSDTSQTIAKATFVIKARTGSEKRTLRLEVYGISNGV
ncbi:MAG: DUF1573 domain-containing protein [Candidatus Hydrogenedentes bacterium]|nr:DUF1573 domain-containing protein [Candidatus Hydrogenedentota bacterium]